MDRSKEKVQKDKQRSTKHTHKDEPSNVLCRNRNGYYDTERKDT
jgi:hypothetical protein